jgi:hypothetical protein
MTHPTGLYLKGEAATDIEALMQIEGQMAKAEQVNSQWGLDGFRAEAAR